MLNNKFFHVLLVAVLAGWSMTALAQKSDNIKPRWMHTSVTPSNSTFVYDVVTSDAPSLAKAREQALSSLLIQAGLEGGQTVKTDVESYLHESHSVHNNKEDRAADETITVKSSLKGEPVTLTARKVDEYWEHMPDGSYHLTTLYARSPVNVTPRFDDVRLTTNYGARGLWRSAIVPGWGQFYKGSYVKGGLILGGSVLLAGGIIYTENMRQDYMNKIAKTHNTGNIRSYKNSADNFAMGRNICIGALAALYVYNMVDAIVAPGARRVIMRKNADGSGYALLPSLTADGGPAIVAQVTF
ncbi:MAG: hypothetical protein HDR90_08525 [Bacteroides sp.]|nr:hypothetical protein [Bacteroides sp.]